MTTLPDKLRSWARSPIQASLLDEAREYAFDAAAEIERLRSLIQRASEVAGNGDCGGACELLHAEVFPPFDLEEPE